MAAGINLTPDVPVIIGQGILFVLAYLVVKKWIMEPYYLLADKRRVSFDSDDFDLDSIKAKIRERQNLIESSTLEALNRVQQMRQDKVNEAQGQARLMISQAQESSDQMIRDHTTKLNQNLELESARIAQMAEPLAQSLYGKLMAEPSSSS